MDPAEFRLIGKPHGARRGVWPLPTSNHDRSDRTSALQALLHRTLCRANASQCMWGRTLIPLGQPCSEAWSASSRTPELTRGYQSVFREVSGV